MFKEKQQSSALLLTLIVLTGVFVMAVGVSNLVINQLSRSGNILNSVRAYQAADSGMERSLYQFFQEGTEPSPGNITSNECSDDDWDESLEGVEYCQEVLGSGSSRTIKVIGRSGKTRRALSVTIEQGS